MRTMPPIDVVCDASVVLKWFHEEGEEEVEPSRALLELHRSRRVALSVLDLTFLEVANVILRALHAKSEHVAIVLDALAEICPQMPVSHAALTEAVKLAERHGLTVYDAAYAAVAAGRRAQLATMDRALLDAGLGRRPSDILRSVT